MQPGSHLEKDKLNPSLTEKNQNNLQMGHRLKCKKKEPLKSARKIQEQEKSKAFITLNRKVFLTQKSF